jgi:glycosyltransferase involved in cell wall biosynthesis
MRICFIGHQASKEGAGRFLLDEVDYLGPLGISIFAILPAPGPLADALSQRGVKVRFVLNPWWAKVALASRGPDHEATLHAAATMATIFKEWAIDLAYTHTVVAPTGPLAAAFAGIPHVWHLHEFAYCPEAIEMILPKDAMARLLDLTSNIIVFNSRAVAREWQGLLSESKTRVVYNWTAAEGGPKSEIPPDCLPEKLCPKDSFILINTGSLIRAKGCLDAVRAVAKLVQGGLNVALIIVGPILDGAYHAEILEFIRMNHLEDRIRFLGYVEDPAPFVKAAGASLVCSKMEAFGRVTIESMAQGTPVVGANAGGTAEIIEHEVNGLLYPPGDITALATSLRRLISDGSLRKRLSENARKRAERFGSADREMAPLLEEMRKLVGQPNPTAPFGTILGTSLDPANWVNPATLSFRDLRKLLLRKVSRRVRFWRQPG